MAHEYLFRRAQCLALILLLPAFCCGTKVGSVNLVGAVVYRGDSRSPVGLRDAGGFLPSNANADPESFGLYQHTRLPRKKDSTHFVSTSASLGIAAIYAATRADDIIDSDAAASWVYFIRPTPNFIDARKTMGAYAVDEFNKEFAALGGVRWEQVLGWTKLTTSPYAEDKIQSFGRNAVQQTEAILQLADYVPNADYNPALDNGLPTDAAPQLAGFPKDHPAWEREPWRQYPISEGVTLQHYAASFMELHKDQVRWRGSFPLFERFDLSNKALKMVVQASEAAKEASAEALRSRNSFVAAHKAMRAEEEAAKARSWLEVLGRVFDDHSFVPFEVFAKVESYWLEARKAAANSHWRGQTLMMNEIRKKAQALKDMVPQLPVKPESERNSGIRKAEAITEIVDRLRNQIQFGLDVHAIEVSSLRNAMNSIADTKTRVPIASRFIWLQQRESQKTALRKELEALQAEHMALQTSSDEISRLAQKALADISEFLTAVALLTPNSTPSSQDMEAVESQPATSSGPSWIEIGLEIVVEVISLLPTPAAPVLQIVKWGRRAWNALRVARRLHRISKTMRNASYAYRSSLRKLIETSSRLEEMLKNTRPAMPVKPGGLRTWKSMDDIFNSLDAIPAAEVSSSASKSTEELLRELEGLQVPSHEPPPPGRAFRSLEGLLRDLDRIMVPQSTPGGTEAAVPDVRNDQVLARRGASTPGGASQTTEQQQDGVAETSQNLGREVLVDLILYRVTGFLEGQTIMRKWSASDEMISALDNGTSYKGWINEHLFTPSVSVSESRHKQ